jgi:hypothetical protein
MAFILDQSALEIHALTGVPNANDCGLIRAFKAPLPMVWLDTAEEGLAARAHFGLRRLYNQFPCKKARSCQWSNKKPLSYVRTFVLVLLRRLGVRWMPLGLNTRRRP